MNPERWKQIASLYESACEREPEHQTAYLRAQCGEDRELLAEVESLLRQDTSRDGILERVAEQASNLHGGRALPAAIGRYRVLDLVSEGGMGTVYKAEQEHPRRVVALKVIRHGFADPDLLQRFEQESRALGRLQHPGIAQIYEAGAADAGFGPQPYFAMEFIHGLPLLEYANAHKLNTRQRLALIARICDAIQHAHGRGIIHRDLKPGNILVDDAGQPKILDFGVARIMDNDTPASGRTNRGELVGTLAYMSPEQVLADPLEVDARSDVYTVGVLLYELLTGRLPYEVRGPVHEVARVIRETDAAPLREFSRSYRGGLETIVNKTLEKDKTRRYASAADLANDLHRYFSNEPILARPPSATYNLRKLAARHKGLFGTLAAVFAILMAGITFSARETIRADRAERAALLERDRASAAQLAAMAERDRTLLAEKEARSEQVRADQERIRALAEADRAATAAATAEAVTNFLQKDLLAQASSRTQADGSDATPDPNLTVRAALDRAASRIGSQFAGRPAVEASIRQTIGDAYRDLSLFGEAQTQMERVLEIRRRVLGPEHADTLASMQALGFLYVNIGKPALGDALLTELLKVRRRIGGSDELKTLSVMGDLATLAKERGDYARFETLAAAVLEGYRRIVGENHPDTLAIMNNLAVAYHDQGKYAAAEPLYMKVVEIKRRLLGAQHPSTLLSMNNLAVAYRNSGKYEQAEDLLNEVLAARRKTLGEEHLDTLASMNSLALLYQAQNKYAEAESLLVRAVESARRLLGEENPNTVRIMGSLAELFRRAGKTSEAENLFFRVLELRRRVLGPTHPNTTNALASLGELHLSQGRYAAAEPLLREALRNHEQGSPDSWRRYHVQSMLGAVLCSLNQYTDAEPLLVTAYEELRQRENTIPFENHSVLTQAHEWVIQLYQSWGKPDQAAKWRCLAHSPESLACNEKQILP